MSPLVCPHCHTACAPPPGYLGQPLVCPTCGQLIMHAAPMALPVGGGYASPEVPLAGPAAPPTYAAADIADAQIVDDDYSASHDGCDAGQDRGSRRVSWLLLLLLLVASGMFLLASVAVGYVVIARARGQTIVNPLSADQPLWQRGEAAPRDVRWTQAQGHSVQVGPARVSVVRVEIGEARGKDAAGNVIISDGDYLQVLVRVENTTPLPLDYRSWYGNDFDDPRDAKVDPQRLRLRDDADRAYSWVIFDDVERVRWHTPSATIPPRKFVDDVIIFQLPPGATKQNLKFLRLELPAAAVGYREGFYRFEIPRSMIEGVDS